MRISGLQHIFRGLRAFCLALAFAPLSLCADYAGEDPVLGAVALIPGPPPQVDVTSLVVTEGGAGDSFLLEWPLETPPAQEIRITITPDAQLSIEGESAPIEVVFSPDENSADAYTVARTLTVEAVDDNEVEGTHLGRLEFEVADNAATPGAFATEPLLATIIDNDSGGVSITESGGNTSVTEGGGTDSISVELTIQPIDDITVEITPDAQLTVNGSSLPIELTFTPFDWNTPQSVTIAAVDDSVAEPLHSGTLSFASSVDPSYDGLSIPDLTAQITDNDSPAVIISETGGTAVTEGSGFDTYNIRLAAAPSNNVVVTITADSQTRVDSLASTTRTFTPANFATDQSVQVTAVDDFVAESSPHVGTITHSASSPDLSYDGIAIANVSASITDNDTPGVSISTTGTSLTEGSGSQTLSVVLDTQPTNNVTVQIDPGAANGVTVNSSTTPINLTFTMGNWNTTQNATVEADDDDLDESSPHSRTVTFSTSSPDADYAGLTPAGMTYNISDNDTAAVNLSATTGSATENGTNASYTIVLATQPTASVTVTLANASGQVTPSPASIMFTTGNWDIPQTITVSAVDDGASETTPHTGAVTHTVTSADGNYGGISVPNFTTNITDNDTPGITITRTGGNNTVTEGGAADTFTIVLNSIPSSPVTITLSNFGSEIGVSPTSLNFPVGLWDTPQTVTVSPNDDALGEGTETKTIELDFTGDAGYVALGTLTENVTLLDDDIKLVFVTNSTTDGRMNAGGGGVTGADAICQSDANKPSTGTYKALLVDDTFRAACDNPNCTTPASGRIDWPLAANQTYFRTDLTTEVFTTNGNAVFVFGTLTNPFATTGNVWTGLNADWTTSSSICPLWALNVGSGTTGSMTSSGSASISNVDTACTTSRRLLCVEQ